MSAPIWTCDEYGYWEYDEITSYALEVVDLMAHRGHGEHTVLVVSIFIDNDYQFGIFRYAHGSADGDVESYERLAYGYTKLRDCDGDFFHVMFGNDNYGGGDIMHFNPRVFAKAFARLAELMDEWRKDDAK